MTGMFFQSFENTPEVSSYPDSDSLFPGGDVLPGDAGTVPSRINGSDVVVAANAVSSADASTRMPAIQLGDKYIVTPTSTGLLIIDKHRAHVRVLYETYANSGDTTPVPSQKVMFPEAVNLTQARVAIFNEYREDIAAMGFELEPMSADTWVINGIPAGIADSDNVQLLTSLLDDLQMGTDVTQRSVRQSIALHLAKAAAVNANRILTDSEVEHLLSNLFRLATPAYTPDGNKVMAEISIGEIKSRF